MPVIDQRMAADSTRSDTRENERSLDSARGRIRQVGIQIAGLIVADARRQNLFDAHAQVEGQPVRDAPVVLEVKRARPVMSFQVSRRIESCSC